MLPGHSTRLWRIQLPRTQCLWGPLVLSKSRLKAETFTFDFHGLAPVVATQEGRLSQHLYRRPELLYTCTS